jgi:hypothetical protein
VVLGITARNTSNKAFINLKYSSQEKKTERYISLRSAQMLIKLQLLEIQSEIHLRTPQDHQSTF